MAMHTVFAGTAGASAAAAGGILSTAVHTDTLVLLIPGAVSALAAVVGAAVALVAFLRHKDGATALIEHQRHDDERFDKLENMIEKRV